MSKHTADFDNRGFVIQLWKLFRIHHGAREEKVENSEFFFYKPVMENLDWYAGKVIIRFWIFIPWTYFIKSFFDEENRFFIFDGKIPGMKLFDSVFIFKWYMRKPQKIKKSLKSKRFHINTGLHKYLTRGLVLFGLKQSSGKMSIFNNFVLENLFIH